MSKIAVTPSGVSRILPLVLALAALFIWASVGQANTEQPTYAPPEKQVAAPPTSAGGGEVAAAGDVAVPASAEAGEGADSLGISLLPTTGGPLLPLIGLGAIALGATGLLARHRYSRR